jgi:hypothetical protein
MRRNVAGASVYRKDDPVHRDATGWSVLATSVPAARRIG